MVRSQVLHAWTLAGLEVAGAVGDRCLWSRLTHVGERGWEVYDELHWPGGGLHLLGKLGRERSP